MENKDFYNDPYRQFIFIRTYSRWVDKFGRRETWEESVDRYMLFMNENLGDKLSQDELNEIRNYILEQKVMPSMRLLWSSGEACRRTNTTAYNCAFIAPTELQDFGEILYLLTCGCGVGFSVEKHIINKLPFIKEQTGNKLITHFVEDSREGWADALVLGLKTWFEGNDIEFDFSKVRPAGARLQTMGGRASGPEPLDGLLKFAREKILSKQKSVLAPIDVHDIICKIGDIVVMGGVRRSSEISLSDLDDLGMRDAKKGQFYLTEPQRSMSNNSVAYKTKPSQQEFMREWLALMESGSGERGIFNRAGLEKQMPKRRWDILGEDLDFMGTNPCGEITLRSKEFCNLTEVVARSEDDFESLKNKVRIATIIGTYQSSLTNFRYLHQGWKKNCEAERLLGVSITGFFDCPAIRNPEALKKLREYAVEINKEYAKRIGINPSVSITCIKPSGTVSQLVNTSSGIHPRYASFFIRRVRISNTDPLFKMLKEQGVPYHPEVGQIDGEATTYVLEFPVKAPQGSITRDDITALEQLEWWKMVKLNWCEHNPSTTIYISEDEWLAVASWLWDNWDLIGGLSFLPKDNHVYRLAPYDPITEEEYDKLTTKFPIIDYSALSRYELDDQTQGASENGCANGGCIVDLEPEQLKRLEISS